MAYSHRCIQCYRDHAPPPPAFCSCGSTQFTVMHGTDAGAVNVGLDAGAGVARLDVELPVFAAEGEAIQPDAEPVDLGGIDEAPGEPGELAPEVVALHAKGLCGQNDCGKRATHRFTWPGRPELLACPEHAERASRTSEAMGFFLEVMPL